MSKRKIIISVRKTTITATKKKGKKSIKKQQRNVCTLLQLKTLNLLYSIFRSN